MNARHHLAALASSVEGVKVAPYWTQSLEPGHGSVLWAGRTEDEGDYSDGYVETWQVRVNLPADIEAAEQVLDSGLLDRLTTVLQAAGYRVTGADPVEVLAAGATTNALVLTAEHLITLEG